MIDPLKIGDTKIFHKFFHMAKTRSAMFITVLVMCTILIFYSPLSSNAQITTTVPRKMQQPPQIATDVPNTIQQAPISTNAPKTIQQTPVATHAPKTIQQAPIATIVPKTIQQSQVSTNVQKKAPQQQQPKKVVMPLYVFGDSLYDTGMALYVDKGPAADAFPYGETYFKKPAGRFSDGLLIPDFIAQFANLPFPTPYKKPGFTDFSKSVNFADASAGVLVDGRPNTLNLKLQTDYYIEMVGRMKKKYGKEQTKKLVKRAVHIFNLGANDYVDVWNVNPKPLNSSLINSFVNKILGNFTVHITRMYDQGARKFAFHGYGPMGCLPAFLQPDGSCSEDLNDLAKIHNDRFGALAKTWARQLPGFKYTIYDFYPSVIKRLTNGPKYGFKETQSACCGSGPFRGKFTCMDKANFTLCDDPNTYLWFDAGHPTQKGDLQFAQEFWNGASDLVAPRNLKSLFTKQQDTI